VVFPASPLGLIVKAPVPKVPFAVVVATPEVRVALVEVANPLFVAGSPPV
jgi:hypothetical protein